MRTSATPLDPALALEISRMLPQLLASIHTEKEMDEFLKAFFRKNELNVFAKRLALIYWLKQGKSYLEIRDKLKVSSATIVNTQNNLTKEGSAVVWRILQANEWAEKMTSRLKRIVGKAR